MAGWEELTPDQIIYIVHIISIMMIIWVIGKLATAIIYYKSSKNISESSSIKKIEDKIIDQSGIKEGSLWQRIRNRNQNKV